MFLFTSVKWIYYRYKFFSLFDNEVRAEVDMKGGGGV